MNKFKNLVKYLLYFFAFILTLQTRWIIKAGSLNGGYFEYGTISLYFTDIILLFIFILFIIFYFKRHIFNFKSCFNLTAKQAGERLDFRFLIIVSLCLITFISIFLASDKILAIYKFFNLILGAGLLWILIKAEYDYIKLIYSFLAGIFLQAGLGLWQFLTQSTFANKWLGLAQHIPSIGGTSVIETLNGERWLRAYGGLDHPNILGGVMVTGILILIWIYIKNNFQFSIFNPPAEQAGERAGFKLFKLFIFYFTFIIFILTLFFTFSRGAWLALIISLIFIILMFLKIKEYFNLKNLLKLLTIAIVLFLVLIYQYKNLIITRTSGEARLEIKSTEERVESYKLAYKIIKEHPFFGVGIGNYELSIKKINPQMPSYFYQPVHNTLTLILGEIGIFGLIILIYLLILYFKFIILNYKDENKNFKLIINLSLILAIFILIFFDHWFWSLHFGIIFIFFIMGLIFIIISKERENLIEKI